MRRHRDWLEERAPAAADRASDALLLGLRQLAHFPESGEVIGSGLRKLTIPFGRDGFVAYYRVGDGEVVIRRVFHGRQRR